MEDHRQHPHQYQHMRPSMDSPDVSYALAINGVPSTSSSSTGVDEGETDRKLSQDQSFLDQIARKQAQIINGFPLASLNGITGVVEHLAPLYPKSISNFPPVPKASPSTSSSATVSSINSSSNSSRTTDVITQLQDDPLFRDYAREANLLMGSTKVQDSTVNPADWDKLKISAASALSSALASQAADIANIAWKDPPFGNPKHIKIQKPYFPSDLHNIKRADPSSVRSLAVKLLDDVQFSYGDPTSHTPASLSAPPPALFDTDGSVPEEARTFAQQAIAEKSKAFLRTQVNRSRPVATSDFNRQRQARSPIPLVVNGSSALPSSSANTTPVKGSHGRSFTLEVKQPLKFVAKNLGSGSLNGSPAHQPVASTSKIKLPHVKSQQSDLFPSPVSQFSTSPDPLALPPRQNQGPTLGHRRQTSSTSSWVVEIPTLPKKRGSSANLRENTSKKRALSPSLPPKHGPFSEVTTSEMDVEPFSDDDDDSGSSPVPVVTSSVPRRNDSNVVSGKKRDQARVKSSPSKMATLKPTSQLEEQLLMQLNNLIEEILDAEDSATPGYYLQDVSDREGSLLELSCIKQLRKAIRSLSKTSSGRRVLADGVDSDQLGRILTILSRSITAAETTVIVPKGLKAGKGSSKKSPSKTPKAAKKQNKKDGPASSPAAGGSQSNAIRRSGRSSTPASSYCEDDENEENAISEEESAADEESTPARPRLKHKASSNTSAMKGKKGKNAKNALQGDDEEEDDGAEWDRQAIEALEANLTTLKNGIHAVETLLSVLTSGSLPKHFYPEEDLNSALSMLKVQLANVIYPCLNPERTPIGPAQADDRISKLIKSILAISASVFSEIVTFLKEEDAAESTLINAVYIAVAPFFIEQGSKGRTKDVAGAIETKVVQNDALQIIRTIFARYPEQRPWIIEEVLSSITKLPDLAKRKPQYLLQNGQAIQAISALLLHLVQCCTSGLREQIQEALRESSLAQKTQQKHDADGNEDEADLSPMAAAHGTVEPAFDSAKQCAGVMVGYLVKRSGKATKNSTAGEAEYKALLEHFVRDLLIAVDLPEWPVATLMIQMSIKAMTTVLEDPKVTADVNTAKGLCLEHLGTIGSKIYKMSKKSSNTDLESNHKLQPITQVLREQDRKALRRLSASEETFIQQLMKLARDDEDMRSAADFASARWSVEMLQALRILQSIEDGYKAKFEKELYAKQRTLWDLQSHLPSFQSSSDSVRLNLFDSMAALFPVHGLAQAMDSVLQHVLESCEGVIIAFRQKALKALAQIVEQDPAIFLEERVRKAVEKRLMDNSPAVRDAALEMLGRYVTYRPDLAVQYLARICERSTDAGLSVRKRVLKLLKSLYLVVEDPIQKADICRRIVGRVFDEDDNVKELASSTFEEIFLTPPMTSGRSAAAEAHKSVARHRELLAKSRVLVSVASEVRDRSNPLEETLRVIFDKYTSRKNEKSKDQITSIIDEIESIVQTLIDALVDPSEQQDLKPVHCVKTVFMLISSNPGVIDVGRAALLLPYLKSATSSDEQVVVEYLSKVYALILPVLPKSASTFTQRLQDSLRSLLNKPAALGVQALPDVVACFCAVVVHQTNDYGKLCTVFQTCYTKLQAGVEKLLDKEAPPSTEVKSLLLRNMPVLARLVSLFCQFGGFDRLRQSSPDAAVLINAITQDSIEHQVYKQMIQLYSLSAGTPLHGTALQCLGFLYRAYPMFMLDDASTTIMDKIFLSTSTDAKALLLRILCDFLVSQSKETQMEDKEHAESIDMRLLIGNTDNFADSGVSSAIVQRYLHHILEAALTPLPTQILLRPALEAIGFTVKQGLAHPMQCLPVLVALETHLDPSISAKAFSLHSHLHEKHSALINTRIAESITSVVRYQNRLMPAEDIVGYKGEPPVALLSRWYALMREKRQWRLEFLKAFSRGLHVEPTASTFTQENVNVARFTAENLATFDYKSQEEVFFVIKSLTVLLSVAGMQIYHQMQKEERLDMVIDEDARPAVGIDVVRKSVVLAFVFTLRHHLKLIYGVTDQKLMKYALGKKSPAGDKPAVPKSGERSSLTFEGLPFIKKPISTEEDMSQQCHAYVELIDSDGSIREPEVGQDSDESDA